MNLSEFQSEYVAAYSSYKAESDRLEAKIEEREAQIERLKARRESLACPTWIDALVKPIADLLAAEYPDRDCAMLGPHGICARVSLHLYRKGLSDTVRFQDGNYLSITFEPGDLGMGELRLVDYTQHTRAVAPNTIGEVNGMNHPSIPMTDEMMDGAWLRAWIEKQAERE